MVVFFHINKKKNKKKPNAFILFVIRKPFYIADKTFGIFEIRINFKTLFYRHYL